MPKKDLPFFVLALFVLVISALFLKAETEHLSLKKKKYSQ
jgi:hypothetical protein